MGAMCRTRAWALVQDLTRERGRETRKNVEQIGKKLGRLWRIHDSILWLEFCLEEAEEFIPIAYGGDGTLIIGDDEDILAVSNFLEMGAGDVELRLDTAQSDDLNNLEGSGEVER